MRCLDGFFDESKFKGELRKEKGERRKEKVASKRAQKQVKLDYAEREQLHEGEARVKEKIAT